MNITEADPGRQGQSCRPGPVLIYGYSFTPGTAFRKFQHQLRAQFQSRGKGDPLIPGSQAPDIFKYHIAILERQRAAHDSAGEGHGFEDI